jgi:hypothetical protein
MESRREWPRPIKEDPREMLNIKELQTVVVNGKAKRRPVGIAAVG